MSGLARNYFSTDPGDREAAKQHMRELQEMLREYGISRSGEMVDVPEADRPAAGRASGAEASGPAPDPGEVFRNRLQEILEEAVSRLEDLAGEVQPDSEEEEPFSD